MLINTWKRNSLLKQAVSHYASCSRAEAIHVVWSEIDPPSDSLKAHLEKLVSSESHGVRKPSLRFEVYEEDNLNNRFKPIEDLKNDAVFSVDDDVIVPCRTLDFAFTVWQSASDTMVGFVPRTHWLVKKVSYTLVATVQSFQRFISISFNNLCIVCKFCFLVVYLLHSFMFYDDLLFKHF